MTIIEARKLPSQELFKILLLSGSFGIDKSLDGEEVVAAFFAFEGTNEFSVSFPQDAELHDILVRLVYEVTNC